MKILVIEDDRFALEELSQVIEDLGHECLAATGADAAFSILEANGTTIDAAILDIMMPKGRSLRERETKGGYETGIAIARRIKKKFPSIELYGLSATTSPESKKWFSEYADGYFTKPTSIYNIVESITTPKLPLPSVPANTRAKVRSSKQDKKTAITLSRLNCFARYTTGLIALLAAIITICGFAFGWNSIEDLKTTITTYFSYD